MCAFLGLQMSLNPTLPQLGLGPVSYFGGKGRVEKSNLDPWVNLSTKKDQCPPGCQETGRRGHKGSLLLLDAHLPPSSRPILQMETLSFAEGKGLSQGHTGHPRQTQARAQTQDPGLSTLRGQLGQARQWGSEDIFTESEREVSKEKEEKRSSRQSFQGWSPAQPVPGLREGGNDAAWARGSLRSTIHRESACGGSQDCRGSGKEG